MYMHAVRFPAEIVRDCLDAVQSLFMIRSCKMLSVFLPENHIHQGDNGKETSYRYCVNKA